MDMISIVVPFFNEEDCIFQYCNFIDEFSKDRAFEVEIVFVDDGSTDNTCNIITSYNFTNCQNIKLLRLSKNYGSHAAIRAGIFHASGNYTVFVGADLQEPDDMVSIMYEKIITGFDIVYIEKITIKISVAARFFSLVYSALMRRYAVKNYMSGGIGNIMFNEKIKNYLNNNIASNSSLVLQILDAGFNNATIKMDYKPRFAGTSKWTLSKKIKLFIDSFVAFSVAPIRIVSIVGIIMSIIGFFYGVYIIIHRIFISLIPIPGYATLMFCCFSVLA